MIFFFKWMDVRTFPNKIAIVVHETEFFAYLDVDGLVFSKVIEAQMGNQQRELLLAKILSDELSYLSYFTT